MTPADWPSQLLIAIPCAELSYSRFWQQLLGLKDFGWHVANGRVMTLSGSYIHDSHNKLVKEALGHHKDDGWNRILFLEHDHEFEPTMLEKHGHYSQPVVGGTYVKRDMKQPIPVVFKWDQGRHNAIPPSPTELKAMLDNPGLHEVDIIPMGCTSIRRDVLENWPAETPRFFSPVNPSNDAVMSDDVWFCRQAQDQGYPVYLDTSNRVEHLVLQPIGLPYFVAYWNKRQKDAA